VEEVSRFRISSIEPNLLTDEIIEFVSGSERFMPHFHIPLQSGSDRILRLMKRRYLRDVYTSRVAHIRKMIPGCCIGVDVIVGFPGETDEDFEETYRYLNELDISYLHVFTYSERDNTPAVLMPGAVPSKIRAERSSRLHMLSDKKRRFFYEQHIGKEYQVLFENDIENGMMHGFTENYIRVALPFDPLVINEIQKVQLSSVTPAMVVEGLISDEVTLHHPLPGIAG
jgi:threonylcarbamoyladenosine tRNA methylthiotransferase MtaB